MLTHDHLEELVRLVNEELDSTHVVLKDKLDAIDANLADVTARLSRQYDALETEKLSLDDLAPRIKQLREKQDELSKARIQTEAEVITQGPEHIDAEMVKSYAQDLRNVLEEASFTESKTFLRSFIEKIVIDGSEAVIHYNLPVPPDWKKKEPVRVLPIDTLGGAEGTEQRTFSLAFRLAT